jgi:ADP-ribose pyrophosphatase
MTRTWPKIRSRQVTTVSPWMDIIAREVEFAPDSEPQIYHAVGQMDYLAIVALTSDGRIPIVHQYRPAIEAFTWELPAGLIEPGEEPAEAAKRELLEETGYSTVAIHSLGVGAACTGRLSNYMHSFFVEAGPVAQNFEPESGIKIATCTPSELMAMVRAGEFPLQLHLGALFLAQMRSFLTLPA